MKKKKKKKKGSGHYQNVYRATDFKSRYFLSTQLNGLN